MKIKTFEMFLIIKRRNNKKNILQKTHHLLYILNIFIILISQYSTSSNISLVIEGRGIEENIISDLFNIIPSKVFVNGKDKGACKKCKLENGLNNVSIIFDNEINTCAYMFSDLNNIKEIDLSNFNTSLVINMSSMFMNCNQLEKINLWNINTTLVQDMGSLFEKCTNLKSIDLSYFDTSSVTNMNKLFSRCESIKSIDASSFDTSKVEDMFEIFGYCENLIAVNVSSFNTSKVKNMGGMFYHCNNLKYLDFKNLDGSSVTKMDYMFSGCNLIYLNLKSFKIKYISSITPDKFNGIPIYKHFCLNDIETKQYFSTDKVFTDYNLADRHDCSSDCFIDNIKIDSNYKCTKSCSKYEYNNICMENCPTDSYKLYKNNNIICSDIIPENYYEEKNNDLGLIYKECYKTCRRCNQAGNEANHNCIKCINGYTFINDPLINKYNCVQKCEFYYYFNENREYECINS